MFGKGKMYKNTQDKELHAQEYDLLFPEETQEPSPEITEIPTVVKEDESKPFSTAMDALDNNVQHVDKQRKVSKIIVLFDDGTYQEL